jgi:hypothetical protein
VVPHVVRKVHAGTVVEVVPVVEVVVVLVVEVVVVGGLSGS